MKLACHIVKDLLPLYEEGLLSPETTAAVREHLTTCADCGTAVKAAKTPVFQAEPLPPAPMPAEEKAVKKTFRKIRIRWGLSLVLVLVLVVVGALGWNEARGVGLGFSNLRERAMGRQFVEALVNGNYEKAYTYMDLDDIRADWESNWFEAGTLNDLESRGQKVFLASAGDLVKNGGITDSRLFGIYRDGESYTMLFEVTAAGEKRPLTLSVTDGGIRLFGTEGSFVNDELAYFAAWTEWLWEDYAGVTFDTETGTYRLPDGTVYEPTEK